MELVARQRRNVVRALARAFCRLALVEQTLLSSPHGFGRRARLSCITHRPGLLNLIVGTRSGLEQGNWPLGSRVKMKGQSAGDVVVDSVLSNSLDEVRTPPDSNH